MTSGEKINNVSCVIKWNYRNNLDFLIYLLISIYMCPMLVVKKKMNPHFFLLLKVSVKLRQKIRDTKLWHCMSYTVQQNEVKCKKKKKIKK